MPMTFPLRLPASTRSRAIALANQEGISLNQFIGLAVVEKIARLESLHKRASTGKGTAQPAPGDAPNETLEIAPVR